MNGFFSNLVDRHLGTCDTIQPRKLGRFETERGSVTTASADEGAAEILAENSQALQTPSELSADSPTVANHKHEPIQSNQDFPSPSRPDHNNPAAKPALTEERIALSDSRQLSRKPPAAQSLDADMPSYQGTLEREQLDIAARVDDININNNRYLKPNDNKSDDVMHHKNPPPSTGEHVLDNELNHRIRLMLKRLTDETETPPQDDRGSQRNETQLSILPETEVPLSDSDFSSLDMPPASSRQATREENRSSRPDNNSLHSQLEPPSWLTDMESRFNQQAQQQEANTEPVINVTIGRVEVRAVHAEAQKNARHSKKPTGVMTLEDYLKQREGRGTR